MNNNLPIAAEDTMSPLIYDVCDANRIVNEIYSNIEAMNNFKKLSNHEICMEKSEKRIISKILNCIISLFVIPLVTFFPVFIIVSIPLVYLYEWGVVRVDDAGIMYWSIGVVIATLSIGTLFILNAKKKKKIKKHHDAAILYHDQALIKEKIANELAQKYSKEIEIFPAQYRYPLATNYIAELFVNGRATTIPEAIDKFEEQKHRWTVERNQQTMILQNAYQSSLLVDIWRWM